LTWLRHQKASSLEARLARRPSRSRVPNLALVTCYVSPLHSQQVKGESHASVCGSRSHALIPTGALRRPAALPKPIIISVPRPHCWKGSASKPYVELPPHTAPLSRDGFITYIASTYIPELVFVLAFIISRFGTERKTVSYIYTNDTLN
jgi:hypothetical protein